MTALTSRPAETAGAAGAIAGLVARVSGVRDPDTLAYITAGVGLLPAVVTTLVNSGGIRGLARLLWQGRQPEPSSSTAVQELPAN